MILNIKLENIEWIEILKYSTDVGQKNGTKKNS
jgi:hypothetical protein